MSEKILPYDRGIVPQEKPWDCGPAATQVVLNSRGIIASEDQLIREIGTTVNGTDYVGLIERVLDVRIPDARYTSVYLEHDPPNAAEKSALWSNVVRSINAGFGVVMNWVAPPSNYPRGVKGSSSPSYRGGTVYHYVACMGYDDTPGARALWIADSGFQPFGYWISFDQAASLIPPKGYAFADLGAAPAAPIDARADVLARVMGGAVSFDRYIALAPAVSQCLAECGCDTMLRIAMWAAQLGHEAGGLRYMEEIASGDDYEGRTDLGNTQPGDGRRFKGRGPIQVTGRHNYTVLSRWAFDRGLVPTPAFFVDQPDQLASDRYGFLGVTWYWTTQQPRLNQFADARNIEDASKAINAPAWIGTSRRANGIDDRIARYNRALAMGDQLLILRTSAEPRDPVEELLMSDIEVDSLSIYAIPGEPKVKLIERFKLMDAMIHRKLVDDDAKLADTDALARLLMCASGKGNFTDPATITHARSILIDRAGTHVGVIKFLALQAKSGNATAASIMTDIAATNPAAVQAFIDSQKGN